MATAAQVFANMNNSKLATGPRSVPGKASSRGNSRKHGLASETILPETTHPGFASRLAEWVEDLPVETAVQRLALETVVAMTFRLAECAAAYRGAVDEQKDRARHAWEIDRIGDAADLLGALSRRPEVVAPRMRGSAQGIAAMLTLWDRLGEALDAKEGAWSESEVSTACDLLGIPIHLRDGRLPFDPLDPMADRHEYRDTFTRRESERLRDAMEGGLAELDSRGRERAESGASALQSKPVRLVLRYEREAARRYDKMLAVVKSSGRSDSAAPTAEAAPRDEAVAPPPIVQLGPIDDAPAGPSPSEVAAGLRELAAIDPELAGEIWSPTRRRVLCPLPTSRLPRTSISSPRPIPSPRDLAQARRRPLAGSTHPESDPPHEPSPASTPEGPRPKPGLTTPRHPPRTRPGRIPAPGRRL